MKAKSKLALLIGSLLPVALAAQTVINVDFSRDQSVTPNGGTVVSILYGVPGIAPDAGTTWNDCKIAMDAGSASTFTILNPPYTAIDLKDSYNQATTVDLELTSGFYRAFNNSLIATTANTLRGEWVFANNGVTATATFKGLNPLATYDLYLYGATRSTTFTVGATSKTATPATLGTAQASWVAGTEYVYFNSLTSTGAGELVFTMVSAAGSTFASELSGLQIVAVPEPSTSMILIGSFVGLALALRRRR